MKTKDSIPYGLKDDLPYRAVDVPNGKNCGCICPQCHEPLEACHPKKNISDYFRHESKKHCEGALETSLHLAAKDILLEEKRIVVPVKKVEIDPDDQFIKRRLNGRNVWSEERTYLLDDVVLENKMGDIVPDVKVTAYDEDFFIEIYVTHKVDEDKISKIKEMNISALEIDLSKHPRDFTRESLKEVICDYVQGKDWLHLKERKALPKELRRFGERYRAMPHSWDGQLVINTNMGYYCPVERGKGQGDTYIEEDCKSCPYLLGYDGDASEVYCGGRGRLTSERLVRLLELERSAGL